LQDLLGLIAKSAAGKNSAKVLLLGFHWGSFFGDEGLELGVVAEQEYIQAAFQGFLSFSGGIRTRNGNNREVGMRLASHGLIKGADGRFPRTVGVRA